MQDPGSLRTLDELTTLHELEPTLYEVITEGRTDAGFVAWFLVSSGLDVDVYAVDDRLYVDEELLTPLNLSVGSRNRVIAGAIACEDLRQKGRPTITFVADADFDYTFSTSQINVPGLLYTDYTSIELYSFSDEAILKFLRVALRVSEDIQPRSILNAITKAAIDLFVVRWILQNHASKPSLINNINRRCQVAENGVYLDFGAVLRDSLGGSSVGGGKKVVDAAVRRFEELRGLCDGVDPRRAINGHDFALFLCYYLTNKFPHLFRGNRRFLKAAEATCSTLLTCVEHQSLKEEPLFKELLSRVSP